MNVLFTPKYTFSKVAIVFGFVEENCEYLHCFHFVFWKFLVGEVAECFMEFWQPISYIGSYFWMETDHVHYFYQLITNPRMNELLEEDRIFFSISATGEGFFSNPS